MRYLPIILLMGCGSEAYLPAVTNVILEVARIAREQTGKDIKDVPVECEYEHNPDTKKILILCEADLAP